MQHPSQDYIKPSTGSEQPPITQPEISDDHLRTNTSSRTLSAIQSQNNEQLQSTKEEIQPIMPPSNSNSRYSTYNGAGSGSAGSSNPSSSRQSSRNPKYFDPQSANIPYSHTEMSVERVSERMRTLTKEINETQDRTNRLFEKHILKKKSGDKSKKTKSQSNSKNKKGNDKDLRGLDEILDQACVDLN